MKNAMNRATPRSIGVARAVELMHLDDDWHPWLTTHRIDTIFCHTLTPMNATLTVWEAQCYDQIDGVIMWTADGGVSSHIEMIETSPGKAWWLE